MKLTNYSVTHVKFTSHPQISIIIPVYNSENTLIRCLDSVERQTIPRKEIICIDDCSSDTSLHLMEQYSMNHSEIMVISLKEKVSTGAVRNVGLDNASGEYISFMDADDEYANENALELLYTSAKENNVKLCRGMLLENRNGIIYTPVSKSLEIYGDGLISYSNVTNFKKFQSYLYSAQLFKNGMNRFPERTIYEDPPFLQKVLYYARNILIISDNVYIYHTGEHILKLDTADKMIDDLNSHNEMLNFSFRRHMISQTRSLLEDVEKSFFIFFLPLIYPEFQNDKIVDTFIDTVRRSATSIEYNNSEIRNISRESIVERFHKDHDEFNDIIDKAMSAERVIIFGARNVAMVLAEYLKETLKIDIEGFAVSNESENADSLNGIEVHKLSDYGSLDNAFVIIATGRNYPEIFEKLESLRCCNFASFSWAHYCQFIFHKNI